LDGGSATTTELEHRLTATHGIDSVYDDDGMARITTAGSKVTDATVLWETLPGDFVQWFKEVEGLALGSMTSQVSNMEGWLDGRGMDIPGSSWFTSAWGL
jgi:hypothetical protein